MDLSRRLKDAVKPLQKSAFVQDLQEKVQQLRSPNSETKNHLESGTFLEDTIVPQRVPIQHALKDPAVEEALLDSIDPRYYDEKFDSSLFELEKLADGVPPELVNINRQVLEKQLAVVTNKVYQLIVGKQSEYSAEIVHVVALQSRLTDCLAQCVEARRALRRTQTDFTDENLRVLQCARRRNLLMDTLSKLSVIKTLHQTDIRLYELLEMREYPTAIQLLLECRQALQDYQQFDCMKQLSLKFDRTLEKTEQQLDVALSKLCLDYNEEAYAKLTSALTLLGRGPNILDQLLMHFTLTIHNLSLVTVAKHGQHGEPGKKQYADLCQAVNEDRYPECLRELAQAFFRLMVSYRQVLEWHERGVKDEEDDSDSAHSHRSEPEAANGGDASDVPVSSSEHHPPVGTLKSQPAEPNNMLGSPASSTHSSPSKEKVGEKCLARQKLRNGLHRLWSDMQQKFKLLLSSFSWHATTEFDKFIAVINTTKVMVEVGELFCEQSGCSSDLETSAEEQCLRYLHSYHGQSLATLKTYLEHESWELMPVRDGFSLDNLHEFCFLHAAQEAARSEKMLPSSSSPLKTLSENEISFTPDAPDPFAVEVAVQSSDLDNSIFEDEGGDDEDDDEKKSLQHRFPKHAITNTSLTIFRLLGRYLNMMAALGGGQKVTALGLSSVVQLFEYYLHTVSAYFASESAENFPWSVSPSCRRVLQRIKESLSSCSEELRVQLPDLTPLQDGAMDTFSLRKRVAACESLTFLSVQLQLLLPQVEGRERRENGDICGSQHVSGNSREKLDQFTVDADCARELYHSVYLAVPAKFINLPQILDLMSSVNWDLRDIQTQHSPYVDLLLQQLTNLEQTLWDSNLPKEVLKHFWIVTLRLCSQAFIEGFASAKKCSNAGRALMQLDWQQFLSKVERMRVKLKPVPDQTQVEALVRAYYLIDRPLEEWLVTNGPFYSKKQLLGLVNSMSHVNRRARQSLVQMIEEQR
ncbi:syndetin-like isoform X2 [Varroa jacobsoni]|uniref:Coiled-coil domain-containing protein 132 n=1 Tax=Varroa destructor TaxID=109461 RepID=A0A7M7KEF7_VARDE|nr:syndetin-like isoform X2 [Varroa destructor]XP_022703851.1 syndetin-like isoform X2 [Varroa jacobsoni]